MYDCDVILLLRTDCNNRHKYYHNNPHHSEFMDNIFGWLTGMKATAVNLEYFTDLLEIKHVYEYIFTINQWKIAILMPV